MNNDEKEADLRKKLRFLVESELLFKVRALGEGTAIKKEDMWKVRKLVINDFFASLSEDYKKLPDAYEIIYDTLNKLERKEISEEQEK